MGENIVSLILLLGFEVTMTKVGCYFLARVVVARVLMVIKGFLIIGALGSTGRLKSDRNFVSPLFTCVMVGGA